MTTTNNDRNETCKWCKFWQEDERDHSRGECRVGGPSRTKSNRKWPETLDTDWCGRYKWRLM